MHPARTEGAKPDGRTLHGWRRDLDGDITGTGKYSFDRITNLASGTAVLVNGVEVIEGACVLGTCGGDLYSKWHEHDQRSGSFLIEQSFHGGTGPFARAHGSIRIVDLDLSEYTGQLGF